MKIQPIRGVSEERLLLGLFYIQKDKIYKIEPTEENIEIIRKENKIPTESNIVCQEGEIKDNLKQEQKRLSPISVSKRRFERISFV